MHTQHLFRLDGQVAVVTGGSGLYGKLISRALGEMGATVILASRSAESCERAAEELRRDGLRAEGRSLDLESEESVLGFAAQTAADYGRIDMLVNNAVSRVGLADLEHTSKEGWEAAQRVNGTGLMLITKAVVAHMRERRSGSIINISSIQGAVGPHFPVYGDTGMTSGIEYTFSKWGMVGFTKWLANYYAKYNIRANCISPGGYNPGLLEDENRKEFVENYKALTPMGRFADEEDIKGPVVFLASRASQYVTGHNLLVDGGWTNW
ncbi:SDR family NAD(P)-dependent oxidoreductase [Gordoniibacillus kamchatkensis]|nr:SDR family oxidoreductase [Paenibacillus sp. VKM B-2647]